MKHQMKPCEDPSIKRRAALALVCILFACLPGCDSKKASTGNFKAALQKHFDEHPACIGMTFPEQVAIGRNGKPSGFAYNAERDQALKDAGLLTVKESTIVHPANLFGPREEHVLTYDIAPAHKDQWRSSSGNGKADELCYAKIKIESVDNFSEPGDMLGHTISEVDFTYALTDFSSWTQSKEVQGAMPAIKSKAGEPEQKSKTMLILTHNGWEPEPSTRL